MKHNSTRNTKKRAQKALEHHLKVLELAHKLPIDEFEEFHDQEIETYGNVLQGILCQLDYEMKGIE